jgi:hypothetical protein
VPGPRVERRWAARPARSRVYPGAVRLRWLSPAMVAALALGGCGGSDGPPKIENKADFIAAADKICVERDASSTKLTTDLASDNDLAKLSGDLAAIYDKAIKELQALSLPPGPARAGAQKYVQATLALRKPVEQMRGASANLTAAIKTRRTAAVKDAGQQLQISVNTVQALGDVADAAARDYGMRNCGQSATSNPVS